MKVDQMMSKPVVTCSMNEPATRAAQLMWDEDIGCVVVLDEGGQLAGIVTDRDLCMASYTRGLSLAYFTAGDAMSKDIAAVHLGDRLGVAEGLMRSRKVRRLPVLDAQDKVVGLLSLNDVARASQPQGRGVPAIPTAEVAATLSAICEPRHATNPRS